MWGLSSDFSHGGSDFALPRGAGNKTWNNTFVAHVAACTMKGAREYRRNSHAPYLSENLVPSP